MNELVGQISRDWGSVCRRGWIVRGGLLVAGSVVVVVELFALTLVSVTPLELKCEKKFKRLLYFFSFLFYLSYFKN